MDGCDVYVSTDLANWEGPREVYHTTPSNWATRRCWAPEVHRNDGTFNVHGVGERNPRQTPTILSADNPLGPSVSTAVPSSWERRQRPDDLGRGRQTYVVLNSRARTGTPINPNGIYYADQSCPHRLHERSEAHVHERGLRMVHPAAGTLP